VRAVEHKNINKPKEVGDRLIWLIYIQQLPTLEDVSDFDNQPTLISRMNRSSIIGVTSNLMYLDVFPAVSL